MSVAAQTQRPRRPPTSVTLLDSRSAAPAPVPAPAPETPSTPSALKGAYVDTIVRVSPPLSDSGDIESLVSLLAIAYDVQSPSPSADDPLNSLMRTLSADRLASVTTADFPRGFTRDEVVQSFTRFLSPVLHGLTGLVDFEQAVDAARDPFAFRRFWTLDARNLLAEATAGTSPPSAPAPNNAAAPASFVDAFIDHPDARRLALTRERGLLALVPSGIKPGDEVWTVSQLSRPVMVRRNVGGGEADGQTYQVIGEAYVHGLCDSEPPSGKGERYKDVDLPLSSLAVGLAGSIPR